MKIFTRACINYGHFSPKFERIRFIWAFLIQHKQNITRAMRVIVTNSILFASTIMEWNVNRAWFFGMSRKPGWNIFVIAFILPQANKLDGIFLKKKNVLMIFLLNSFLFFSWNRLFDGEKKRNEQRMCMLNYILLRCSSNRCSVYLELTFVIASTMFMSGCFCISMFNIPSCWCMLI